MSTVEHCQSLLKEKEGRRRIAEVKKTCQLDLFQAGSTVFLDQKITHFSKIQIKVNFKQKQTLNFCAKTKARIFQIFEIEPNSLKICSLIKLIRNEFR